MSKKRWYDYLWIATCIYFLLGFVNILFAWMGLICFILPLILSLNTGTKSYCNAFCGRGQLLNKLGGKMKRKRNKPMPRFFATKGFRYGFLIFFLLMFANIIFNTYLVFSNIRSLEQAVTLFWTIKLPWSWTYIEGQVPQWVAQFSFGFYSLMLTSTLIGIILMFLFRPRAWCVICPMGTMTQLICKKKHQAARHKTKD